MICDRQCYYVSYIYKASNGKAPDYISAMFRYVSDVHKRTTRQTCNNDLYVPSKATLNVFRNTIRNSGTYIWNWLDYPASPGIVAA